jgi:hypothetical protein
MIYGFGFYIHNIETEVITIQLRTRYKIKDATDTNVIGEEITQPSYYVEFPKQTIDENKIIKYDFTQEGIQPIKLLAGQHFHLA